MKKSDRKINELIASVETLISENKKTQSLIQKELKSAIKSIDNINHSLQALQMSMSISTSTKISDNSLLYSRLDNMSREIMMLKNSLDCLSTTIRPSRLNYPR